MMFKLVSMGPFYSTPIEDLCLRFSNGMLIIIIIINDIIWRALAKSGITSSKPPRNRLV